MIGPRHAVTVSAAIELPVELAADRLPVFPCAASKAPMCPGGFKAATCGPKSVQDLWRQHPGPLIGVRPGAQWNLSP